MIVVLLVVLIRILFILRTDEPSTKTDMLVTDGTYGLYLGWVTVATTSNIAAAIADATGLDTFDGWEWAAAGILAVVAAIGLGLGVYTRGRIAPALSITWGLIWVAIGRTSGDFESLTLVWAAAIAAGLVWLGTVAIRIIAERKAAKTRW